MTDVKKIITGGQTGVDLAALDYGMMNGITVGGWCPKGRLNEAGKIPAKYPMIESSSKLYSVRTEKNVLSSDATLIFTHKSEIDNGTKLCIDLCELHKKAFFVFDIFNHQAKQVQSVQMWLREVNPKILNIAGNRESTLPGIYIKALKFLSLILGPGMELND